MKGGCFKLDVLIYMLAFKVKMSSLMVGMAIIGTLYIHDAHMIDLSLDHEEVVRIVQIIIGVCSVYEHI